MNNLADLFSMIDAVISLDILKLLLICLSWFDCPIPIFYCVLNGSHYLDLDYGMIKLHSEITWKFRIRCMLNKIFCIYSWYSINTQQDNYCICMFTVNIDWTSALDNLRKHWAVIVPYITIEQRKSQDKKDKKEQSNHTQVYEKMFIGI
jgi:hypothetical protein